MEFDYLCVFGQSVPCSCRMGIHTNKKNEIRSDTRFQSGATRRHGIFHRYHLPILASISSSDGQRDSIFCREPPGSCILAETSLSSIISPVSIYQETI